MNSISGKGGFKIGTVIGIPIRVHFSWFIVFGLISWTLAVVYFPQTVPELAPAYYWIMGIVAALMLFVSVAFHELSHSYVAKLYRMDIESITLLIFGGIAMMKGEPPSPQAETRIALAGPLSSFFLAGLFLLVTLFSAGALSAFFTYLAQINFIVGVFNLIPGYPMDGGRVLRAAIWKKHNNFFTATRKASRIGQKVALFFIFFGVLSLFTRMPGGLWLMLIGWFLYSAAQASYEQTRLQEALSGVKVRDIMARDIVTLEPSITIEEAVQYYFLRYGYGGFPVAQDGQLLGIATLREIKSVPRENWSSVTIGDIFSPRDSRWEISSDDDVIQALEKMTREEKGRLVIVENGELTGLITKNSIAQYMQIRAG
jgi:Zn-dependent protease/CBS domain-containing protein